jgi:hypothetical protein
MQTKTVATQLQLVCLEFPQTAMLQDVCSKDPGRFRQCKCYSLFESLCVGLIGFLDVCCAERDAFCAERDAFCASQLFPILALPYSTCGDCLDVL